MSTNRIFSYNAQKQIFEDKISLYKKKIAEWFFDEGIPAASFGETLVWNSIVFVTNRIFDIFRPTVLRS